jgi:hypothetical protein
MGFDLFIFSFQLRKEAAINVFPDTRQRILIAPKHTNFGFCGTVDAETISSRYSPLLESLQTAQEEGCWPGPTMSKVISKVELVRL